MTEHASTWVNQTACSFEDTPQQIFCYLAGRLHKVHRARETPETFEGAAGTRHMLFGFETFQLLHCAASVAYMTHKAPQQNQMYISIRELASHDQQQS